MWFSRILFALSWLSTGVDSLSFRFHGWTILCDKWEGFMYHHATGSLSYMIFCFRFYLQLHLWLVVCATMSYLKSVTCDWAPAPLLLSLPSCWACMNRRHLCSTVFTTDCVFCCDCVFVRVRWIGSQSVFAVTEVPFDYPSVPVFLCLGWVSGFRLCSGVLVSVGFSFGYLFCWLNT